MAKPETPPVVVPGLKRAVAWVQFTKPTKAFGNFIVTELTAGGQILGSDGFVDVPAMFRDASTAELVIGTRRIPLASGLVGPYELADAAKGKVA
jgi:hypothetical protein